MRIIYLLLKITLNYSLRVFFRKIKLVNSPKEFFGRTIYVSNHAASFLDPLVVASLRMPIVFFMTRSDVFTPLTKPLLWACHMLPLYRQHDGEDLKQKNEEVFERCARILSFGRNLLIFGEGFTDDTFIRRLKPVKKGAIKIGFNSLEKIGWKKNIYMAAVGCNYSDPGKMRSELLISTSKKICLNDYKDAYEANPNKVITEVTRLIEQMMQEQITHVQDKSKAPLHERIMMLTRKGMNNENADRSIPLVHRWKYSQHLAHWINSHSTEEDPKLAQLEEEANHYFSLLKKLKLDESDVHWKIIQPAGSTRKEGLLMILLFPFALLGFLHTALPYFITKRFVEKSFKRKVFWSSVKIIMGKLLIALVNLPLIFVFYSTIYPSWWLWIGYFFSIGLTGFAAYMWFTMLQSVQRKKKIAKMDLSKIIEKRSQLKKTMESVLPSEFH